MLSYRDGKMVVMCDGCFEVIGDAKLVPKELTMLGYVVEGRQKGKLVPHRYKRGTRVVRSNFLDACDSKCADKAWKKRAQRPKEKKLVL